MSFGRAIGVLLLIFAIINLILFLALEPETDRSEHSDYLLCFPKNSTATIGHDAVYTDKNVYNFNTTEIETTYSRDKLVVIHKEGKKLAWHSDDTNLEHVPTAIDFIKEIDED